MLMKCDHRSKGRRSLRPVMKIQSACFVVLIMFLACSSIFVDAQTPASGGTPAPMGDVHKSDPPDKSPPTPATGTKKPNLKPTVRPTAQPTKQPKIQPTKQPTAQPTRQPKTQPTKQPTAQPTRQPKTQPTKQPTEQPTRQPKIQPTERPTPRPSPQPTVQPSPKPTLRPTLLPTSQPTSLPTKEPTQAPTPLPTEVPTRAPFDAPTPVPSRQPTPGPTPSPTPRPSVVPTETPSKMPNRSPTQSPTVQPTTPFPTFVTLEPTVSARPSLGPSPLPTEYPSSSPIASPTVTPSLEPTPFPSPIPSSSPTLLLQNYWVGGVMKMSSFSTKLTGEAAIAWEDVTTAYIWRHINDLDLEDPIFDLRVKADMGTQVLLPSASRRFLQSKNDGLRSLQLQFTVEVKYRSESDLHDPAGWIEGAFDTNDERSAYTNQLIQTNEAAFDDLERVELVMESVAAVEAPSDPSGDEGNKNMIIIAVAAGSGALFVGLIGLFLWSNPQTKGDESIVDDSPTPVNSEGRLVYTTEIVTDGEEEVSTLGVSAFGGTQVNRIDEQDEQTASIDNDYDWRKTYGQAQRTALADETSSVGKHSLYSWFSRQSSRSRSSDSGLGSIQTPVLSNDTSFEVQYTDENGEGHNYTSFEVQYTGENVDRQVEVSMSEEEFEVEAPPGKLGIVIDAPSDGLAAVHAIKSDSVLADRVQVGDRLLSVDGEDVTALTSMQVCRLIARKSRQRRLLVFVRSFEETDSVNEQS